MPDVSVLNVLLYGERIGTLTFLQGERSLFAFNDTYINNENRPTLSLSFKDSLGNSHYRFEANAATRTDLLRKHAA